MVDARNGKSHRHSSSRCKIHNYIRDVQRAYHQIPITDEAEQDKTAYVAGHGKRVFKRLPFGMIANAPFLFQRTMALSFAHFGPKSGLLGYVYR